MFFYYLVLFDPTISMYLYIWNICTESCLLVNCNICLSTVQNLNEV